MSLIKIKPATVIAPSVVSIRQARLALLQLGLLSSVETAVANANEATKISWEYTTEVHREDPLVQTLSSSLNLTPQDLDSLFILASTL
jgi:hypothetical protein